MFLPIQLQPDDDLLWNQLYEHLSEHNGYTAVAHGALNGAPLTGSESAAAAQFEAMGHCELIFIGYNRGVIIFPLAAFTIDGSTAVLHTLLSTDPLREDKRLDSWAENSLVHYCYAIFHSHAPIERVLCPFFIPAMETEGLIIRPLGEAQTEIQRIPQQPNQTA